MSHSFMIDPGQPEPNVGIAGRAVDLQEAIQMCFPMDTCDARVQWGDVSIPLSYKYDLGIILDNIVGLMESCIEGRPVDVRFGSDTFSASWSIRPLGDSVAVESNWYSVVGDTEVQLNRMAVQEIPKRYFLEQWCAVLRTMVVGVDSAGVAIQDRRLLETIKELIRRVERNGPVLCD